MAHKGNSPGLTLVEIMVSLVLISILAVTLLLLFTRGTRAYVQGKAEQESVKRLHLHLLPLCNQIRGATALKSVLPAAGSPLLAFTYVVTVGGPPTVKWIELEWNAGSKTVIRRQYAFDALTNTKGVLEETTTVLTDVDSLRFLPDPISPQLLLLEYQLVTGLPRPLTVRYKLLVTPKLPMPEDE